MIQISPLALLAFGELLLISCVASLGMIFVGIVRKRNERRAVARLIGRIKQDQSRRRAETRTLMQENYGFQGEELDSITNRISREESHLYQALINLFLRRDLNLLEVLNVECEGVTEPYRTLEIPKPDPGKDSVESDLAAEVEMLKEENERLSTELGVTMDTMGKMLKEYASMYGGGSSENLDKAKLMESFRNSGNDERKGESVSDAAVENASPDSSGDKAIAADDMVIEKEEAAEASLDQEDSGLFDDAADMDIGEMLGDETVVINGMEELAVLNDETLAVDLGDDELVELDDEDLNLEETIVDNGQLHEAQGERQKSAG